MNVLLDTHAVIWAVMDDPQLGDAARRLIRGGDRTSLAIADMTLLEAAMLANKGRIEFPHGSERALRLIQRMVMVVPMDADIACEAMELDLPQGDPFDRVIVATARRRNLTLITRDRAIRESGLVEVVW